MSQNSNIVLFITNDHQYDGKISNPPMLSNTAEKSVFYFTDSEGTQYIYVHDYPTKTDWIQSGVDIEGWEGRNYIDRIDLSCDLKLDAYASYWLACCYAVTNHLDMAETLETRLTHNELPKPKKSKKKLVETKVDDIG